jgi:SAM-dependent methyltransferase
MSRCACCQGELATAELRGVDRLLATPGAFSVAQCPRCAAGLTLPEEPVDRLGAFYPSGYSAHQPTRGPTALASAVIGAWNRRRALKKPPLAELRARAPGRMVDVGCGRGDLGAWLIRLGWKVTGVEPSPEAAAAAQERGLDVQVGSLADADLPTESYDAASFQHSLEHLPDPVADLGRVAAALRPGGVVLITVPHFGGAQARLFGSRWYHLDLPRHRVHFTRAGLRRALERSGFTRSTCARQRAPLGSGAASIMRCWAAGRSREPAWLDASRRESARSHGRSRA